MKKQFKIELVKESFFKKDSLTEPYIEKIKATIQNLDCQCFSEQPRGKKDNVGKREFINDFQFKILEELRRNIPEAKWDREILLSSKIENLDIKDKSDIYGKLILNGKQCKVIVELDTIRADQISKKFISRTALTINDSVIYIAIIYPGTMSMNINECKKYFAFCKVITEKLSNDATEKIFIGYHVKI